MKDIIEDTSLYHYTTFQSLSGMLINKELWLGNLKYMNDKNELVHFMNCLRTSVEKDLIGKEKEIKELFERQEERFKNKTAYAFSFTRRENDASQWDRYANGGTGVCIKFNRTKIEEALGNIALLHNVYYQNNADEHQAKALIEKYILTGNTEPSFKNVDELFENAWNCAIAFKHESFNAEDEVRICSWPFLHNVSTNRFEYKLLNDGMREYFVVALGNKLEKDINLYMEEICLGPNAGVDINMFFRYLQSLDNNSHKIKLSEASCPLR